MKFEPGKVQHSINKAFLKEPVERKKFDTFKESLGNLLSGIEQSEEAGEREEHFKNLLPPFFKSIGFGDYKINTSSNIDLAIYTGSKTKDPLGVMMEVKRPSNKAEMISTDRLNRKAMHEAVLYYLEQRIDHENSDLKHIIITDMLHWYIFDAQEFERCFYRPSALKKLYRQWKDDQKVSSGTDFMYNEIASFISTSDATINGIYLPLKPVQKLLKGSEGSEYEKRLISLYKFFSPIHLLKEPFANDSNSLNKEFYRELLYILGLEETKEGSTRYIRRREEKNRNSGSIIENTIRILDAEDHLSTLKLSRSNYGANREEQLFSVAMELGITWINRILFLKLLEAQLFSYHRKDKRFKFLNYNTINGLDELNKLFFQVLARKASGRSADVNEKFGHIPYLNSSLFDVSSLEHQTTRISGLDDHAAMPVYGKSVLTDNRGETLNTLDYLFRFLEAYDFSAEGSEEIRDESKSLINASVLGLIFEKINGYKDGSFYTPGFITEYMARETLRKAVIDKFDQAFSALTPVPSPRGRGVPEGRGEGEKGSERGMSSPLPGEKLPDSLLQNARYLRKNQTDAEELLWGLLRKKQLHGLKFRRQHPIEEGFVLDFYCHEKKLAVELDGEYHNTDEQRASDKERDQFLNDIGVRVIRFSNKEVLENTEAVLKGIAFSALTPIPDPPSPPAPLPPAGEGSEGVVEEPEWKLPDSLIENARYLRKNQTDAEKLLWGLLRNRQFYNFKFKRQHPIKPGFILDFYCAKKKLAVEVDGGTHDRNDQKLSDQERTQILNEKGIDVIRFKNEDVLLHTETVLRKLAGKLGVYGTNPPSLPSPPPQAGEGWPAGRGEGRSGHKLTFKDIYNRIGRDISIEKANDLINSITICDPAVGSGHFLVSCLNELIAIKSELGILADDEGKLLRGVSVEVENDELIITHGETLYEYDVSHTWSGNRMKNRKVDSEKQRIQKTLFHEKRHLIENCLFGVDINPNSVKICRLRLWIELLKRAYYQLPSPAGDEAGELHVLPNIDINIKQGNSLVSRFELDSDLSAVFKKSSHSLEEYKRAVRSYKQTGDRTEKTRLQHLIDDIKNEYSTTLYNNAPVNKKLSKERGRLEIMQSDDLFGEVMFTQKQVTAQKEKVKKLEEQKAEEEAGAFYNQAFEWRFEFPEVLDDEGRFTGFDLVIANPPYIPLESFSKVERDFFRKKYSLVERKFESSILFLFRAFEISKANAPITFIAPVTWETGENYKKLRGYLFNEKSVDKIINLPFDIFEDAYVETGIFIFKNSTSNQYQIFIFNKKEKVESFDDLDFTTVDYNLIIEPDYKVVLDPFWARIINRLNDEKFKRMGDITFSTQGLSGSRFEEKKDETDEFNYPFLSEGQVYNYEMVINKITYTSLDNDKSNLKKFYQAEPKLLIRRIVNRRDRLDVGYTETKLVVKKDINPFIIDDTRFIPEYVLGIMASRFVSAMYVNTSSIATKDDFRQTTLTELRNILIPLADKADQEKIAKLADQILTTKNQNSEVDTTELEEEIDRLVYELYGLSEEEIGVVEGSS